MPSAGGILSLRRRISGAQSHGTPNASAMMLWDSVVPLCKENDTVLQVNQPHVCKHYGASGSRLFSAPFVPSALRSGRRLRPTSFLTDKTQENGQETDEHPENHVTDTHQYRK